MKHKDMGKAWKKIAAVVLTAAMVLSASAVSVLATTDTQQFAKDNSSDTFSITIKPNNDANTEDADFTNGTDTTFDEDRGLHTYSAYQIFKGDLVEKTAAGAGTNTDGTAVEITHADKILSNIEWGTAIPESSRTAFISELNTEFGFDLASDANALQVAEKIATLLDSTTASADSSTLADIIGKYVSVVATGETPTASQTDASDAVTLKVSGPGYYFVKDTAIAGDKPSAYTDYILQVLSNVTIQTKSDVPTVQKKVDDVDDTTGSEDTINWQDSADYDVGDKIEYKITGTLPDNLDVYSTYSYKFTDSMSSGLKYNEDGKVYAYLYTLGHNTDGNPTFLNPAWYDVTSWFNLSVTDDMTLTIAAKNNDIKQIKNGKALTIADGKDFDTATLSEIVSATADTQNLVLVSNKTIETPSSFVVRYTCDLDTDAVIGSAGNPNTVKLEFSNNPNGAGTGETIEDKVIVFTYEVDVNKVKESQTPNQFDPLVGADFRLDKFYKSYTPPAGTYYIDTVNKIIMKAVDGYHYAQNAAGEVKLIKNGETVTGFTDIAATTLTGPTTYENYWVEVDSTSGTLGTDSTFKFERIDAGNYKITEIVTPAGYNSVEPITFTVVADHETKAEVPKLTKLQVTNISPTSITFAVDGIEADNGVTEDEINTTSGVISTDVVNKAGVELPSTGGMGTTLFYVIGAILVIGAGVVLVTRRRMA